MTDSEQEEGDTQVSLENLPTTDTEEERRFFSFFSEVMICNFMRFTAKDVCSICLEELDPDTDLIFEPMVSHRRLALFRDFSPLHYRDVSV